ncbi:MAG: hypothetical protein Q9221_004637 [Calogaya cf. arnoldii]
MEQDTIPKHIAGLDRSVDQGQFVYRPLNQGRREIRLVQLGSEYQVANDRKRIPLLQMHHAFFDGEQMPQYIALSYTWGTGPKGIVLVEDEGRPAREVLASTNLLDALCHFARLSDPEQDDVVRTFWIDQLCINQNDNYEKSHQVRMMTDICGRATMTNVWLGSRGATLSHEEMKKYHQEFYHVWEGIIDVNMMNSELASDDSIVSQRTDRILSELCQNDCKRLRALNTFLRFPIAAASLLEQAQGSLQMTVEQSRRPPRTKPLIDLIRGVLVYGQTKATQPEDLVYSMMGIASDGATCGIEIDYDKHYSEVFREAALLHLKGVGAQALTWSCQWGRDRDPDMCHLPSWVPDLGLRTRYSLLGLSEVDPDSPKIFSAAGNRVFEFNTNEKSEILSVRTSYTDRVVEVSKPFDFLMQKNNEPAWNYSQRYRAWVSEFERFLDAANDRYPMHYDVFTRQEMRWRIPIANCYVDKPVLRRAGLEVKDWYMATLHPDDHPSASAVSKSSTYKASMHLMSFAFVTNTGYIGMTCSKTVIGDELHLIQGSDTPFILRKNNDQYTLLSEAYVHGIMGGELVDDNTEFEWLQLH